MTLDLTAIIACKNRNTNLSFCIRSIVCCAQKPFVIVIDYGSNPKIHAQEFGNNVDLRIIRVEKNTDLFHKARALNIGIKAAQTTYTCITDSDQIFQNNFFEVVFQRLQTPSAFVMCHTHFLKKLPHKFLVQNLNTTTFYNLLAQAKNEEFKKPHGEGCCHGVETKWLKEVRGYDEQYIGWGFEDKDLALRAVYSGKNLEWIHSQTSMVHLPHDRDKKYFNFELRTRNEKIFERKKQTRQITANIVNNWGLL